MKARAALPDNTGDGVAAVRAEVQRLNEDQGPEAGGDYLDDAIARQAAEMGALLGLGVKQDRMRNDPMSAADKLLTKLRMEVGNNKLFNQLHFLRREWYERGRDGGLNFEARVAIHLAEACRDMANGKEQRGTALNDLGIALKTLGERETGTARLDQAVDTYTEALKERTRDKVPLDWAMTQNNLGIALATLGARETGTARLDQAVDAYTEALKEWTHDKVPLQWAMTQNNLGNALQTLGARETGTARLDQAVDAYTEALKERTRDKVPLDWAMTQNNLGNALAIFGERETGTARLDQAVDAYTEALKERTRDKVPLDWATTQNNLCIVEISYFDKTNDALHLDHAQSYVDVAREVFVTAGADHYLSQADKLIANIAKRRAGLGGA